MLQTVCNSKLKRGGYGQLKQGCSKSMLLQDYMRVQFLLIVWVYFLGLFLGSFFVAIDLLGFFNFY